MRRFIETTPEFQSEKVPVAQVFKAIEEIERKARSYLVDVVWHRLDRIKSMYKATLGIDFPVDAGAILRAILVRHDIVPPPIIWTRFSNSGRHLLSMRLTDFKG